MRRPALHITVTEAHLLRAWREHKGPGWPATFAEAMAHPMYSRLLRPAAIGLAVSEQQIKSSPRTTPSCKPSNAPSSSTPAPTQAPAATPARPRQAALFDPKRLASGDRDDD